MIYVTGEKVPEMQELYYIILKILKLSLEEIMGRL
jgi:hypothetical protein